LYKIITLSFHRITMSIGIIAWLVRRHGYTDTRCYCSAEIAISTETYCENHYGEIWCFHWPRSTVIFPVCFIMLAFFLSNLLSSSCVMVKGGKQHFSYFVVISLKSEFPEKTTNWYTSSHKDSYNTTRHRCESN
jgi:hypothetical protein